MMGLWEFKWRANKIQDSEGEAKHGFDGCHTVGTRVLRRDRGSLGFPVDVDWYALMFSLAVALPLFVVSMIFDGFKVEADVRPQILDTRSHDS